MTKRSYTKTDKKGREETWEWDETPELAEFIKKQTAAKLSAKPTRPT